MPREFFKVVWHGAKVQTTRTKGGCQRLQQQRIGVGWICGKAICGGGNTKFIACGNNAHYGLPMHGQIFIKMSQQGNVVSAQFCSGLCQQGSLWHVCPTGQHMLTSGTGSA